MKPRNGSIPSTSSHRASAAQSATQSAAQVRCATCGTGFFSKALYWRCRTIADLRTHITGALFTLSDSLKNMPSGVGCNAAASQPMSNQLRHPCRGKDPKYPHHPPKNESGLLYYRRHTAYDYCNYTICIAVTGM